LNSIGASRGGATGSGVLLRLSFQAVAAGHSDLALNNVVLLDSPLAELQTASIDGTIDVSAVPEPASAALLGMGLAVLTAKVRRRPSALQSAARRCPR
jgi:hypothetical protein